MRTRLTLAALLSVLAVPWLAARQTEPVDLAVIARIKAEGQSRSQTAAMFTHLVDTIGPRLSGSPEYTRSAEWARDTMAKWGLANAKLEPFEFGRGWELEKFVVEMVEPRYMPLVGYPEAWSPSTSGEVVATVVNLAGKTAEEAAALKSSLKGGAILQSAPVDNFIRGDRVQPTDAPPVTTAVAPPPGRGRGGEGRGRGRGETAATTTTPTVAQTIATSGAAVLLRPSRGEHGTLFVQAGRPASAETLPPRVVLIGEHYNLLSRLTRQGIAVKVRVNVQAKRLDDTTSENVLAEIPGTDPKLRDEVVMLGAHLDSWHIATGATDNADGVVAAMEAFRIIKALNLRPRRTLRLALWGGEEQGLLGSAAYVRDHLAGESHAAERAKLAVYFNIDPGKGPIYGWFLENNPAAQPIFDAWLAPFTTGQPHDIGARRNVPQGIGNTDHLSFIRAGMIGFNPIQDYVGYDEREHHTNVDTAERIRDEDLKQAAIILASFVYHAANRADRIPAK
jgi:carboxypeptidase Q